MATVTPSFVTVGEPKLFSITTLRPFGPSVTRTALASWLTPREELRPRVLVVPDFLGHLIGSPLLEHAEDIVLANDEVLFAFDA